MGGFPLSGWLIMIVPPALMILSVVIWYFREVKRERLEDELIEKKYKS
jgi:Na+-transporting NADH:ubiquinone oxidoreductase subunit NqrD